MISKVKILGNGQQAPYGIGEIIDIIPATHWRKIQKLCARYYNAPDFICNNCGKNMEWLLDEEYKSIGIKKCKCQK